MLDNKAVLLFSTIFLTAVGSAMRDFVSGVGVQA